jgi:hypothetical protein
MQTRCKGIFLARIEVFKSCSAEFIEDIAAAVEWLHAGDRSFKYLPY